MVLYSEVQTSRDANMVYTNAVCFPCSIDNTSSASVYAKLKMKIMLGRYRHDKYQYYEYSSNTDKMQVPCSY